jgi:hypothetical protein
LPSSERGHEAGVVSVAGGLLLSALLAAAVALASGCSFAQDCTDAGCSDGVGLDRPTFEAERNEWLTLRACVEGECGEQRADFSALGVEVDVPEDRDEVTVTFTVLDEDGRVLLDAEGTGRVQVSRPNGDDCPPECRFVRVRLAGGRLVPVDS